MIKPMISPHYLYSTLRLLDVATKIIIIFCYSFSYHIPGYEPTSVELHQIGTFEGRSTY